MKRKYTLSLFIASICIPVLTCGQDSLSLARHTIKFSPFHLVNRFATIQVAYEYRPWKQTSVQLDAGYVLSRPHLFTDDFSDGTKNNRGVKLGAELRYYHKLIPAKKKARYIAVEIHQNFISYTNTYYESGVQYPYRVQFRDYGASVKLGHTQYVSRFIFDFNVGISVHSYSFEKPSHVPSDRPEIFFPWMILSPLMEEEHVMPRPVLCYRIAYRLK